MVGVQGDAQNMAEAMSAVQMGLPKAGALCLPSKRGSVPL